MYKKMLYPMISIFVLAFLIAGCTTQQNTGMYGNTNQPQKATTLAVKTIDTSLGTILSDTKGFALYIFTPDTKDVSTCYNACAVAWPPLTVPASSLPIGQGVAGDLGVTLRTDGTYQVTINGLPLYYYQKDTLPGDINGQGVGGKWYVISQSGEMITTAAVTAPSATTSQMENVIKTSSTSLGTIMVGTNGMSLYIFQKDTNGMSACYDTCAQYWPPLLVSEGKQPSGVGTTATLGTTKRTDGTIQVTANGMPLYYYAGDRNVGDVNGQGSTGSGALWYVLSPNGEQITTPLGETTQTTTTSTQTTTSTGGYSSYTIEGDDKGLYPDTITVPKGSLVTLILAARAEGTYHAGLDFKSPAWGDTGKVMPGDNTTVNFTADQSFDFKSYWPSTGVLKATGHVIVE